MRRNWMIGAGCVLALVVSFAAGYRAGACAGQLIDARQAGEDSQRAFEQGIADAQRERNEKDRLEYEQRLKEIDARSVRDRQNYEDIYRKAYDEEMERLNAPLVGNQPILTGGRR